MYTAGVNSRCGSLQRGGKPGWCCTKRKATWQTRLSFSDALANRVHGKVADSFINRIHANWQDRDSDGYHVAGRFCLFLSHLSSGRRREPGGEHVSFCAKHWLHDFLSECHIGKRGRSTDDSVALFRAGEQSAYFPVCPGDVVEKWEKSAGAEILQRRILVEADAARVL